jgi:hypothetical protein
MLYELMPGQLCGDGDILHHTCHRPDTYTFRYNSGGSRMVLTLNA